MLKFCIEVDKFWFLLVCVYFCYVRKVVDLFSIKSFKVFIVINFLNGIVISKIKLYEVLEVVENGVLELDVMVNLIYIKIGEMF